MTKLDFTLDMQTQVDSLKAIKSELERLDKQPEAVMEAHKDLWFDKAKEKVRQYLIKEKTTHLRELGEEVADAVAGTPKPAPNGKPKAGK